MFHPSESMVTHPGLYTPKGRLLHLPQRFCRRLHIKQVDTQLPGSCIYLLKVIDPRPYTPKVRLLHLPERVGCNLHITQVDRQLPGSFIYLLEIIHPRPYIPKVRLLHLPERFGRNIPIKKGRWTTTWQLYISTRGDLPQTVYPKNTSTSSTGAFWS